jgi:hypothetical protein
MSLPHPFRTGPDQTRSVYSRIAIIVVVLLLVLSGFPESTGAAFFNGCNNERAGYADTACPVEGDAALYIESVRSVPGGVSIRLTPDGIALGTTCDGAAWIVLMASGLYAGLPAGQRAYTDLLWADPYITSEVMGHAAAAATNIPQLVAHGNPIDIVFADYSTPGSQGLFWRSLDDPSKPFAPGTCTGNMG